MELFTDFFYQKGLAQLKTNAPNISVYVTNREDLNHVVILFHMPSGTEWSKEQCANVEKQIIQKLQEGSQKEYKLITFLCTNNVDRVREVYRQNDHTSVIDLENNRLLIFEGMSDDDLNIYSGIEKILQSRDQTGQYENMPDNSRDTNSTDIGWLAEKKHQMKDGLQKIGFANSCIILLNIAVFIILSVTDYYDVAVEKGKLVWTAVKENHEYYRLLTCMFLHSGANHLFNNMLILSVIGGILEKKIGKLKYCFLYLLSGIIAGIISLGYNMGETYGGSIGASGAIFGVVGAVLWIVLINKGRVENLSRRQMILFVIFSLYGGFSNQRVDNAAHIGGLISGIILAILIYRKPKKRGVVS